MICNVLLLHTHTLKFYWKLTRYYHHEVSRAINSDGRCALVNSVTSTCYHHRDRHRCIEREWIINRSNYSYNPHDKNYDKMSFLILQQQLILFLVKITILQVHLNKFNNTNEYEKTHYNNRINHSKFNFGIR